MAKKHHSPSLAEDVCITLNHSFELDRAALEVGKRERRGRLPDLVYYKEIL